MAQNATASRLEELGPQVWHLPHVRMALFDELCETLEIGRAPDQKQGFLKGFLTFNRDTSLDIALLLYPFINLDDFPWDCPDAVSSDARCVADILQKRRRAYAAGVRAINVTGCLPLCTRWKSFPEMVAFFPNVRQLFFASTDLSFSTMPNTAEFAWCNPKLPDTFEISQTAWVEDDGSITEPAPFWDIEGFEYKLARDLETGYQMGDVRPLIARNDGQLEIPAIFLQPQREMVIEPKRDEHDDWLRLLQHRKGAGLPIDVLMWGMGVGEELSVVPRLARVVPPDLRILRLRLGSDGPLSTTLDNILEHIDTKHFPNLRFLEVELLFFQDVAPDSAGWVAAPQWLSNDIPEKLEIWVDLVLLSHNIDERTDEQHMEQVLFNALPNRWIAQARRKLGRDNWYRLKVRTYWDQGEGPESFDPWIVSLILRPNPPPHRPASPWG
ncbi:hypothetical protein A1Q2_05586 [Trichosporon asahii var. asahii CBS 8904]|uniref:Uncharacterized protein n=1 Tax=Trichosporon asahii var. asahii (strain CBS 8904) TaxID=1220162 RepID=K1VTW6_TRIAC|nr:hypothetical protein A1Q2_05586 [Trichosporon asahii var. asahii CBS 8904]